MSKPILTALFAGVLIASTAFAQLPLADLPVRVGGYVRDQQSQPIEGALVRFIDQTTLAEFVGTTDATGWYGNLGFSSVPDAFASNLLGQNYPNPFSNSTTVEINAGSLDKSAAGSHDLLIYNLAGRLVGSLPASTGTHQVQTIGGGTLPDGTYFYKLGDEVQKMVGSPRWVTVKVGSGSEKALVSYRRIVTAAGFEVEDVLVSLDDGQINFGSSSLTPSASDYSAWFRVTDGTADNWLAGMTINLRAPNGAVFSGVSDVNGNLTITVPSSYAATDSFAVYISNTPNYSHNVYGMIEFPHCVNKIASTDGMFCVKRDTASVALDQIVALPEGIGFVPLPDGMYEDVEFREMSRDAEQGTGNRDYAYADVTFWNYTLDYPSGLPILEFRLQLQRDVIDFYVPQFTRGTGLIVANVSVVETSQMPSPVQGKFVVYQRSNSGPGNVRGPSGDGQMLYGTAYTPAGETHATLVSEIGSLVGLADNAAGSTNASGFITSGGIATSFSAKGKHLMVYWGTHGTNDGR